MGGKGSYPSPPPAIQQKDNSMAMMEMMSSMMAAVQETMALPAAPAMPAMPAIHSAQEVDWEAKLTDLNTDALDEAFESSQNRYGRSDTILTSPLLDEDEATTTESVLGSNDA